MMVCTIILALLVGLVVTSQTLAAAVSTYQRAYAVLVALGIPRWRLVMLVLVKSFWIGFVGVVVALPVVYVLKLAAVFVQTRILLPTELLVITALLTIGMALVSGVSALAALRKLEPATLLR